ncbi:MAG: FHA domain-containing serine/threonine-protein kinase [Vulcanimicrobiota bacterium]
MEDELTSALAQPIVATPLASFELQVTTPAGGQVTVPLFKGPQSLDALFRSDSEGWQVEAGDAGVELKRLRGQSTLDRSGLTQQSFRGGESFGLLGHTVWVVDVRNAYVGALEGLSHDYQGKVWNLSFRPYRVGRRSSSRHNDIELNDATVSRAQCTLSPEEPGDIYILSESAKSPVAVNGAALIEGQRLRLRNGDLLQLGQLQFRYRQHAQNFFPGDGGLPSTIGSYTVVGKLGAGGMGVVYEGRDGAGQSVAIKVPLPHFIQDEEFVRRFNREMMLGASLKHPRLTRIFHFEPAGQGKYPFLVMEKLADGTLEKQPLPLELGRALEWTEQLLEALECLHEAGVVHRDLKPANLYQTPTGLKVADLGLAHLKDISPDQATQSGNVLGTPAYIDPAVLRGHPCDARSDLYSVGIILYEWLSGSLPYPSEPLQVFRLKLSEDLPPLSQVAPHLPQSLRHFVDLLINSQPELRFRSAHEALHALRELRLSDPELA